MTKAKILRCPRVKDARLYYRIHNSFRKQNKATYCSNDKTHKSKWYEWALLPDKEYSLDPSNYVQLCISCHRKMDYTQEQREKIRSNKIGLISTQRKPVIAENVALKLSYFFPSVKHAAAYFGLTRGAVIANFADKSRLTRGILNFRLAGLPR